MVINGGIKPFITAIFSTVHPINGNLLSTKALLTENITSGAYELRITTTNASDIAMGKQILHIVGIAPSTGNIDIVGWAISSDRKQVSVNYFSRGPITSGFCQVNVSLTDV